MGDAAQSRETCLMPFSTSRSFWSRGDFLSELSMYRMAMLIALIVATSAAAQNSAPQPVPFENRIPVARDVDFPGTMTLKVDATDVQRAIFRVRQTISVMD